MGKYADTILSNGGKIIGIIPKFMVEVEWAHKNLTELVIVDDLHQRNQKMLEGADAVIALPGGCGTLEELLEVITLKRLGLYTKPIVIVNMYWFHDDFGTDFGGNFTIVHDYFFRRPFELSTEIDWGKVGSAERFHGRSTVGVLWRNVEGYSGFDYVDLGGVPLRSAVFGVRVWF